MMFWFSSGDEATFHPARQNRLVQRQSLAAQRHGWRWRGGRRGDITSGWPRTDVGSGGVDATAVTLDDGGNEQHSFDFVFLAFFAVIQLPLLRREVC